MVRNPIHISIHTKAKRLFRQSPKNKKKKQTQTKKSKYPVNLASYGIHDGDSLQADLDVIYRWSEATGMKLNIEKCVRMKLGKQFNDRSFHIGASCLTVVTEYRDLGSGAPKGGGGQGGHGPPPPF